MDLAALAVNGGALAILVAWKVVDHIRVGRGKDQQIATLRSQVDQLAAVTYKGWNDQAVALEQIDKARRSGPCHQGQGRVRDARRIAHGNGQVELGGPGRCRGRPGVPARRAKLP